MILLNITLLVRDKHYSEVVRVFGIWWSGGYLELKILSGLAFIAM
jgi:hypothetical protein